MTRNEEYPPGTHRFDDDKSYQEWIVKNQHQLEKLQRGELVEAFISAGEKEEISQEAAFDLRINQEEEFWDKNQSLRTEEDESGSESPEEWLTERVTLELRELKSDINELIHEIHMLETAVINMDQLIHFNRSMQFVCRLRTKLRKKCVKMYRYKVAFEGKKTKIPGWNLIPLKVRKAGGINLKGELIALQLLNSNALRTFNAELKAASSLLNLQRHKAVTTFNRPHGHDAQWREDRDEKMVGRDAKFELDKDHPKHHSHWRAAYRAKCYMRNVVHEDGRHERMFIPNVRVLMNGDFPAAVSERFTVVSWFSNVIEDKLFPIQGEWMFEDGMWNLKIPQIAIDKAEELKGEISMDTEFLEWNNNEYPCSSLKAKAYAGPGWRMAITVGSKNVMACDIFTKKPLDLERKSLPMRRGNLVAIINKPTYRPMYVHPSFASMLEEEKHSKWTTAEMIEMRNKLFEDSARNKCFVTILADVLNRKTNKVEKKAITLVCNENCEDHADAWKEHEILQFSCKQKPIERVRVWGFTGFKSMRVPLMARKIAKRPVYQPQLTDVYQQIDQPKLFKPWKTQIFKQVGVTKTIDKDGIPVCYKHTVKKDITKGLRFKGSYEIGPPCEYNPDNTIRSWMCYAQYAPDTNNGAKYTILGPWATQIREKFMKALFDGDVELCYKIETRNDKPVKVYQAYKVIKNVSIPQNTDKGPVIRKLNILVFCDIQWINEDKHIVHKILEESQDENGQPVKRIVNLRSEMIDHGIGHFFS